MESPRLSLRKREILRGYQAFSRVLSEGRSLQRGAVRCFYTIGPEQAGTLRVGFSVSRSVSNAAERNRARRWMREAYRRNKSALAESLVPGGPSATIVFILRVRGSLARTADARLQLDQAIVGLLKDLRHHLSENS